MLLPCVVTASECWLSYDYVILAFGFRQEQMRDMHEEMIEHHDQIELDLREDVDLAQSRLREVSVCLPACIPTHTHTRA